MVCLPALAAGGALQMSPSIRKPMRAIRKPTALGGFAQTGGAHAVEGCDLAITVRIMSYMDGKVGQDKCVSVMSVGMGWDREWDGWRSKIRASFVMDHSASNSTPTTTRGIPSIIRYITIILTR